MKQKAILINPLNREIKEVEIGESAHEILGYARIEASRLPSGDLIIVDANSDGEDGEFHMKFPNSNHSFMKGGAPNIALILGKALIVGADGNGGYATPKISVETVKRLVFIF